MVTKNQLTFVKSLHRKKVRKAEGLFLVEGLKMVDELVQSDFKLHAVYALPDWIETNADKVPESILHQVSVKELERMSALTSPNQVLAIAHQRTELTPDLPSSGNWVLALDGVSDPGNLGTIIRTADWFGVKQIVCSETVVEAWNSKVVQASMGSLFRVDVIQTDLPTYLGNVQSSTGLPILGADLHGVRPQDTDVFYGWCIAAG